ncbi:MAG: hypothetical protein COU11_00470 [Candidatus Harrisonbacteria bacterium CG10_big_fil_rev_8_21_14_0_10_49_15]|uniref:Serine aminopeptidase S33 domain-containing protein n=1 Tax=Candidatus Harrisonbacteria bacterium CG10_big_fil_rev_8_21_14_0_10_49_15 TaxID=1974587 RepID=A0A2H0UM71_9BACT|nr:MAG: hypothetical protein COU11_00470 [Candidatus Harrisonbacteria bacterium CG10_big_fil_rev_8_21_14_0_10_49_15]
MKDVEFSDADGNKLLGTISIPGGASSVVIMSHGFSSSKGSKAYIDLEKDLNALGIGTFRYDGYGHGPLYCENYPYGVRADVTLTKSIASLKAAVEYIRSLGSYKIILMGSSYGGLVSLIIAATDSKIAGLALKSPVIEPLVLWGDRAGSKGIEGWEKSGVLHYDDLGEKFDLNFSFYKDLEKFDIYSLAKNIRCNIFVVHGEDDTVVPIRYTYDFAKIVPVELCVVSGADHGYKKPDQYKEMKDALVKFISAECGKGSAI